MIWAWLINSTSVFITAKVLSGVEIKNFWTSLWVAAGISLANFLLGPLHFSDFEYASIAAVSIVALMGGITIYDNFLKEVR